ncbi:MAG: AEC family transporter [Oscillospiraceae bacterium]|jgi:predicted permease|nr:AEC family transporter [Oscillospiraceae bacterium]
MSISVTINQMLVLFIALAVGFGANKLKILSGETDKLLSRLALNIAMPCTIISSMLGENVSATGGESARYLLLTLPVFALSLVIAFCLSFIFRKNKSDSGLLSFMMAFGNVAVMGFPVTQAIFGDAAMFYVALFNIPFTLFVYSFGILMVSGRSGKLNPKLLLNPCLIAAAVSLLLFCLKLRPPAVLAGGIELLGRMTTPVAMLIIGSSLAPISAREVFAEWRLYVMTFVKLLVIPIVVWLILRSFITDRLVLGVLVALAGMPSATSAPMIALEYGGNGSLASRGVFLTTLASVVTIPLLVFFLL